MDNQNFLGVMLIRVPSALEVLMNVGRCLDCHGRVEEGTQRAVFVVPVCKWMWEPLGGLKRGGISLRCRAHTEQLVFLKQRNDT